MSAEPLTLGTAGHIDHGKTALVAELTGVTGDRLPEERARGMTITLGYAPLVLPSGRRVSVIDVPGHERFVRTMVAGATGIDIYLMVVAADDGVMPQTREHAEVLQALGVTRGVVAVTKADAADPARAAREARDLLPGAEVVACSARTGLGVAEVATALDKVVAGVAERAGTAADGPVLLHLDRSFSVPGRGTVVTGTLWAGRITEGDRLVLMPGDRLVRVRGIHVHDRPVAAADAGQRVAINLSGVRARSVARGDVLGTLGVVAETRVLDAAMTLREAGHGQRVQVHHGTRHAAGRLAWLADDLWQLRLERPVLARDGDRVVVRRHAPPDTLGGGVVLVAAAHRHGRKEDILARLRRRRDGVHDPEIAAAVQGGPTVRTAPLAAPPAVLARVETALREAGPQLLSEAQLGPDRAALRTLRTTGRAVRVSGRLYAHAEVTALVSTQILTVLDSAGSVSLAEVRDALGISRKSALAFLEYLDAVHQTRRLPDDRRVRAKRSAASSQ